MTDELERLRRAAERASSASAPHPAVRDYVAALEAEVEALRVLAREALERYHIADGHSSYAKFLGGPSGMIVDCPDELCRDVMERTGGDYLTRSPRET